MLVAARDGATVADIAGEAVPVRGHGAQLPVRGDRQDRRAQPGRGGPGRRRTRLALSATGRSARLLSGWCEPSGWAGQPLTAQLAAQRCGRATVGQGTASHRHVNGRQPRLRQPDAVGHRARPLPPDERRRSWCGRAAGELSCDGGPLRRGARHRLWPSCVGDEITLQPGDPGVRRRLTVDRRHPATSLSEPIGGARPAAGYDADGVVSLDVSLPDPAARRRAPPEGARRPARTRGAVVAGTAGRRAAVLSVFGPRTGDRDRPRRSRRAAALVTGSAGRGHLAELREPAGAAAASTRTSAAASRRRSCASSRPTCAGALPARMSPRDAPGRGRDGAGGAARLRHELATRAALLPGRSGRLGGRAGVRLPAARQIWGSTSPAISSRWSRSSRSSTCRYTRLDADLGEPADLLDDLGRACRHRPLAAQVVDVAGRWPRPGASARRRRARRTPPARPSGPADLARRRRPRPRGPARTLAGVGAPSERRR